ncbi:MAG: DUF3014 domain-containing protein [Burkholderiales bacterium]
MEQRGSRIVWGLVALMAVAVGAGLWAMFHLDAQRSPPPRVEAPAATAPPASDSSVTHPLPGPPPEVAMQAPAQASPQDLDAFRMDLRQLGDVGVLVRFVDPESLVRRVVSTVDNIDADELPLRARAIAPVPGRFAVVREGDALAVDPANAGRYAPLIAWIDSIDARRAAELYVKHYALFQGEYRAQGGAGRYFNDRLVAAIDHLLATPQPGAQVALVQPKVLYRYADPSIERLSAAQKALYRLGRENGAHVRAKLRALRAEVTRRGVDR